MSQSVDENEIMLLLDTVKKLKLEMISLNTNINDYDNEELNQYEKLNREIMEQAEQINKKRQEIKDRSKVELSLSLFIEDNEIEDGTSKIELCLPPSGDNSQYAGKTFGLIMTLNKTDYNDGKEIDLSNYEPHSGDEIQLALTLEKDIQNYLNQGGLKLTVTEPNVENDAFQQFTFRDDEWNTVIGSVEKNGMVLDIANELNFDPPAKTPLYFYKFHGEHNQHFVYKDNMIYAKQNGQVVTFIGGEKPFVMM